MNKPNKLKKGDKIAVVSLSSGILGEKSVEHELALGLKRLREFELEPVLMPNSLKGLAYLKKYPQARAADLKQAFLDDSFAGIICAIGGDDTYRLLPYLLEDKEFVNAVKKHPKIFTGFSDTTINHLLFYKLGMVSYYGPSLLNDLAELEIKMLPYTRKTFLRFFDNSVPQIVKSSSVWYEERIDFSKASIGVPRKIHTESLGYEVLRGEGIVTGKFLGGCLDSLYDIIAGKRYSDEAQLVSKYGIFPSSDEWKDKILFIETSEECPSPALFSKMLSALKKRGVFDQVKAVLLGKPQNECFYSEYKQELVELTRSENLPLMTNLNFGHAYPRTIIPYGLSARIDFNNAKLTITESLFETE
ncbi:S66 family peptidase [Liquorilactobacillus oeni]|uniref:Mccc family protein n=1 Tax=Liquorilactobacillus oeni DSM 19972 TaxID=1423777 RepID=A0A0R1MHA6_9LACO|nr:S66 peptidase family protein [Liquorilactobacillus oeni]KRL04474.1 mccc family protein [Liquorilactobacillus oeni DSM 19972]